MINLRVRTTLARCAQQTDLHFKEAWELVRKTKGKMGSAIHQQNFFILAVFDIVMFSHPQGFLPTASRFAYWMGPAVGMATAFTTTAYAANRLRGKDDKWNYVAGACASASVFGAWQRSSIQGFSMCLAFCK